MRAIQDQMRGDPRQYDINPTNKQEQRGRISRIERSQSRFKGEIKNQARRMGYCDPNPRKSRTKTRAKKIKKNYF